MMNSNIGFSLIEILMVILLVSMTVMTIPAMHAYFKRQGVQLAVEQLCVDLQLSRLMAIKKKKNCKIKINQPHQGQYINSITGSIVDLGGYRGGVHFLEEGPGGEKLTQEISFQRRGMAFSKNSIFLSDESGSRIYRIQILVPGGVSVFRWDGKRWQ